MENQDRTAANFAITLGGKALSWRDDLALAMDAARYVKNKNPKSEVAVRDLRSGATYWTT